MGQAYIDMVEVLKREGQWSSIINILEFEGDRDLLNEDDAVLATEAAFQLADHEESLAHRATLIARLLVSSLCKATPEDVGG